MSKSITVIGLKKCSTCTKAVSYLNELGAGGEIRDVKEEPLTGDEIDSFLEIFPPEKLVNRGSLTWRHLPDDQKQDPLTADHAKSLIQANGSIMKRPLFLIDDHRVLGFAKKQQAELSELLNG